LIALDDIGRKYGTTKARTPGCKHNYLPFYEQFLAPLRARQITLLEIGVEWGFSLYMWRDYFPHGKIVGFDTTLRIQNSDRIELFAGDQNTAEDLQRVVDLHGPFDVIIDDACHNPPSQKFTYEYLLPHVKPGGFFILEDLFGNEGPFADACCTDHLLKVTSDVLFGNSGRIESIAFSSGTSVTRIRD
jgi:demethylmacrocin O-methyltransferase